MMSVLSVNERKTGGAKNYLGTATIKVMGRDLELDQQARSLFDAGAQCSLCTEALATNLGCRTEKAETAFLIHGVSEGKLVYADTYAVLRLCKKTRKPNSRPDFFIIRALILKQNL